MANWNVNAPEKVKGPDKATALATARKQTTVSKIVAVPPPSQPAFLDGLEKKWSDDASKPDPVGAGRWSIYAMEARDHGQHSSTSLSTVQPGRFVQFPSGGPGDGSYYQFTAPNGDNIWTPGDSGRSEMSYPRGGSGGNPSGRPGPYSDVQYFYEGQRAVTQVTIRLPAGWNVNAPSWRVLLQMKQSEWEDQRGLSPALALEQVSGNWIMRNFGGPTIWSMPAVADGRWISFALDVTYSADSSKGKVTVYADKDEDGAYEYGSMGWTGKTLADNGSLSSWIPSTIHTGWYGGDAPGQSYGTNYSIYG